MAMSLLVTAVVSAAPPEGNKVDICHNQTKDETLSDGTVVPAGWYFLNVSVKSFEKHHQKHGDFSFVPGVGDPEETRCKVEYGAQPYPAH
jgi:hypothetical protein